MKTRHSISIEVAHGGFFIKLNEYDNQVTWIATDAGQLREVLLKAADEIAP